LIVEVTNISDGPGRTPTQVDIYNKTLDPGASVKLPAELVDKKVRALASAGLICIGQLPPWYEAARARKGRSLTPEEMKKRIATPKAAAPPSPPIAPPPSGDLLKTEEAVPTPLEDSDRKRNKQR
jgi:hypothetical protein